MLRQFADFLPWPRLKVRHNPPPEQDNRVLRWMQKEMQFYPQVDSPVAGQFVPLSNSEMDPRLVSRIKSAYRLAMERFENAGESPWTKYQARSRTIHNSLLAMGDEQITQILSDPIPTNLFYGFYSLATDLDVNESSPDGRILGEWSVKQIFGCLVRLAEATGAIRLWNPEGNGLVPGQGEDGGSPQVDTLLAAIEEAIGSRVDFPNPFPNEFGLPSSRGIVSYRAPQAIYQAWRTQQLLQSIGGRKFLEIGAGMGRTAYYASRLGIADITLVDLPLANVAQAAFLGRAMGSDTIWLPGDPMSQQAGRIRICPPSWLESAGEDFDVVLNADSMTEMDRDHAISYFREINQHAKLFLSINQEAYQFRVRDLPAICRIDVKVARHPYWMRKGYVEEIFYIDAKR
jgi:hypothetical protein